MDEIKAVQPDRNIPGLRVEDKRGVLWQPLPGTADTSDLWQQVAVKRTENDGIVLGDFDYSTVQGWDQLVFDRWPLQVLVPYQDPV